MEKNYKIKLFLYTIVGGIVGYIPFLVVTYFFNIYSVAFFALVGIGAYIFYIKIQDQPKIKYQNMSFIFGLYISILFSQFLIILINISALDNKGFINNIFSINSFNYDIVELIIQNVLAVIFAAIGTILMVLIFKLYKLKNKI